MEGDIRRLVIVGKPSHPRSYNLTFTPPDVLEDGLEREELPCRYLSWFCCWFCCCCCCCCCCFCLCCCCCSKPFLNSSPKSLQLNSPSFPPSVLLLPSACCSLLPPSPFLPRSNFLLAPSTSCLLLSVFTHSPPSYLPSSFSFVASSQLLFSR